MALLKYIILICSIPMVLNVTIANTLDSTRNKKVVLLNSKKVKLKEVGSLPKKIREASGLEITQSKIFWTHNDDGIPVLFGLDSTANLVKTVHLNTLNRGWEDLTQDDKGNIYIGAFGNNTNDKKDLIIYKIPNPETITDPVIQPEVIQYSYNDQKAFPPDVTNRNFDVDALFSLHGSLFLISKNRTNPFTGYSKIYKLSTEPGRHVAEVVDSIFVGTGSMMNYWVTSVDVSPDQKTIALLFHDHIWFIRGFKSEQFSKGSIYHLDLNHYSHKAGLCFQTNDKIFIVDELEFDLIGGKLYSLDLKPILNVLK